MDVTTFTIGGISAIAVIVGLVKVAREAGLPSKYAPALSVGIGAAIGVSAAFYASSAVYLGLIGGIAAGLMASGLYDLGKKSIT
jgi:hypothetical protein